MIGENMIDEDLMSDIDEFGQDFLENNPAILSA
jgi:hypothetical protein